MATTMEAEDEFDLARLPTESVWSCAEISAEIPRYPSQSHMTLS
jgi:hypothetical protein